MPSKRSNPLTSLFDNFDNNGSMPDHRMISFQIDDDIRTALDNWKKDEGINISDQLRRAIRAWLEQHGRIGKGAKKTPKMRK